MKSLEIIRVTRPIQHKSENRSGEFSCGKKKGAKTIETNKMQDNPEIRWRFLRLKQKFCHKFGKSKNCLYLCTRIASRTPLGVPTELSILSHGGKEMRIVRPTIKINNMDKSIIGGGSRNNSNITLLTNNGYLLRVSHERILASEKMSIASVTGIGTRFLCAIIPEPSLVFQK